MSPASHAALYVLNVIKTASEREPICNLDAEESVLGAMLLSDKAADRAFESLKWEHFYRLSHGELFKAMTVMVAKGLPLDGITRRCIRSRAQPGRRWR